MKGEKMSRRSSMESVVRKRLSDITNSQRRRKAPGQDEKRRSVSAMAEDHIDKLSKENMGLLRLLAERNKIIELSGTELQKLRLNLQKLQRQNWHLAQANSQMLAELNLSKGRLKALRHEIGCKLALCNVKNLALGEKEKRKSCQNTSMEEGMAECEEAAWKSLQANGVNKTFYPERRHQSINELMDLSAAIQQVPMKEKADNKRLCLIRAGQLEVTEDLFEIEDAKFPVFPLLDDDPLLQDCSTSLDSTRKEDKEGKGATMCESQESRRLSIGRPLRKAAEKVQSYKELPLNIKMRRSK